MNWSVELITIVISIVVGGGAAGGVIWKFVVPHFREAVHKAVAGHIETIDETLAKHGDILAHLKTVKEKDYESLLCHKEKCMGAIEALFAILEHLERNGANGEVQEAKKKLRSIMIKEMY